MKACQTTKSNLELLQLNSDEKTYALPGSLTLPHHLMQQTLPVLLRYATKLTIREKDLPLNTAQIQKMMQQRNATPARIALIPIADFSNSMEIANISE
ncbi:MAG TPA: hypothetical protein VEB40_00420 [Flavipsychrobacter sp.]|nr:hypothetical protein [Flavipsychrobacter sp.]